MGSGGKDWDLGLGFGSSLGGEEWQDLVEAVRGTEGEDWESRHSREEQHIEWVNLSRALVSQSEASMSFAKDGSELGQGNFTVSLSFIEPDMDSPRHTKKLPFDEEVFVGGF